MSTIRFLRDYIVAASPPDGVSYREGDVVEVDEASRSHFLIRRVAEDTTEKPKKRTRRKASAETDEGEAIGDTSDNAGDGEES